MKKIFHKLHLWLSVPFGLIITITCFTGAMLVFENEIMELSYPSRYYTESAGREPLPLDVLVPEVSRHLPDSVSINSVNISSNPDKAYQMSLSQPRRASVYVDQYTGEIMWRYQRSAFFQTMFRLHRWLMDSSNPDGGIFWGKVIVGVSTIMFVIALITGIVIWWPRTRKALRNSLKISVRKGLRRFWYDLHIAGGMYAIILLLAMALTGLTWSFPWYRSAFYKVFGVETTQSGGHGQQATAQQTGSRPASAHANSPAGVQAGAPDRQGTRNEGSGRSGEGAAGEGRQGREGQRAGQDEPVLTDANSQIAQQGQQGRQGQNSRDTQSGIQGNQGQAGRSENQDHAELDEIQSNPFSLWQHVYETVREQNPENKQISVSKTAATVSFTRWGNQRASDRYTYDTSTGEITDVSRYADQEKSSKIRGWIYTVHVGSWGGWFSRILTVLASLLGASLPLTGYYLWIKKHMAKRAHRRKAKAAR